MTATRSDLVMSGQVILDTTSTTTRAIVEQFSEAFNRRDVDAVMALMTADCVFENTYPPPDGKRHEGQAAVRGAWETLFANSPTAHFDAEEIVAHGDRCTVRWRYTWVDSRGQPGHIRGIDLFRVRDGKVAEKLSYVKG